MRKPVPFQLMLHVPVLLIPLFGIFEATFNVYFCKSIKEGEFIITQLTLLKKVKEYVCLVVLQFYLNLYKNPNPNNR